MQGGEGRERALKADAPKCFKPISFKILLIQPSGKFTAIIINSYLNDNKITCWQEISHARACRRTAFCPGPGTLCKVQGCSFAQTTWGREMLTALSLSRYPQTQQIFYNFWGMWVCVGGWVFIKVRSSLQLFHLFLLIQMLNTQKKKKKRKEEKRFISLCNFCANSWHNKVIAKCGISNSIILKLPFWFSRIIWSTICGRKKSASQKYFNIQTAFYTGNISRELLV